MRSADVNQNLVVLMESLGEPAEQPVSMEKERCVMYYPSIFNDNFADDLFDEMFDFPFRFGTRTRNAVTGGMATDVREFPDKYELSIELPGFGKDDVHAELKDGYLTIRAERSVKKDTGDGKDDGQTEVEDDETEGGKYIRQERFYGKAERSFYVGDDVKSSDIRASFENGVLVLTVPKVKEAPRVEKQEYIPIEG